MLFSNSIKNIYLFAQAEAIFKVPSTALQLLCFKMDLYMVIGLIVLVL